MAIQRTKSGKIDKRTKEGKAMLENLAKARKAAAKKRKQEASLMGRIRRMLKKSRIMKSDIKNVAAFLAVAIWADGVYAEEEKMILAEIAEVLNVEESELTENVDKALKVLQDKDDEAVQAYIIENASALDEEDVKVLMQCAIEIVLADDVIARDEVQVLFDLADATGSVEHTDVALMLADLVKYNPDIEIEF